MCARPSEDDRCVGSADTSRRRRDIREEYAKLVRAAHQRIELEKSFGVSDLPLFKRTKKGAAEPQRLAEERAPSPPQPPVEQTAPPAPAAAEGALSKAEAIEQLRKEVEGCMRCDLHRTRMNLVFGSGNPNADLMFVGEAPGEEEDKQGEPFVGKAGQLLTKMIEAIGMKRSDVYICNILKSRPPGNRAPMPHEVAACLPFLKKQIRIIRPRILCALGATAAKTLLGTTQPIGALRGRFFDYESGKLLPTFHPSYLLRSPWEKAKAWEDLKKVRDTLKAMKEAEADPKKE